MESRTEDAIAAVLLFIFGSFGFATNLLIFYYLTRFSRNQTFTFLLMSRIFSNLMILGVFLLWTTPVIAIGSPSLSESLPSHIFGWFASTSYMNIVFLEPLILINRLIAIFLPLKYDRICGTTTTRIQILLAWIIAIASTAAEIHPSCSYMFHYSDLAWDYVEGECGEKLDLYTFLIPAYSCNCIALLLSVIIVIKLCHVTYLYPQTAPSDPFRTRYLKNAKLFLQSFLQFCVFSIDLFNNTFLPDIQNRFLIFFAFSFTWQLVHVVDGLLVLFFRKDIRKYLFTRHRNRPLITTVLPSRIGTN